MIDFDLYGHYNTSRYTTSRYLDAYVLYNPAHHWINHTVAPMQDSLSANVLANMSDSHHADNQSLYIYRHLGILSL